VRRPTFTHVALLFACPQLVLVAAASADIFPVHYTYNASFLVTDLTHMNLDFSLYNGDEFSDDSHVLISNLMFGGTPLTDFHSDDPGFVSGVNGSGSYFMLLQEGTIGTSTTAVGSFDFNPAVTGLLEFEVEFYGQTSSEGEISFSNQFYAVLNDVELMNIDDTNGVTVAVPAPAPAFLAAVGLGCVALVRRLRGSL